jgi:hypothetical protein
MPWSIGLVSTPPIRPRRDQKFVTATAAPNVGQVVEIRINGDLLQHLTHHDVMQLLECLKDKMRTGLPHVVLP